MNASASSAASAIRGMSRVDGNEMNRGSQSRPELDVEPVQALDLPPARGEQQHPAPGLRIRARHRFARRARARRGTPRSSATPAARRARGSARTTSAIMYSLRPLSALWSRRMRSSDSPSLPHGTKCSRPCSVPSRMAVATTASPSCGSPIRDSAIENPRSTASPRHASASLMTVRDLGRVDVAGPAHLDLVPRARDLACTPAERRASAGRRG